MFLSTFKVNNSATKISTPFHNSLDFHRTNIQAQHANQWNLCSVKECKTMNCVVQIDAIAEFHNELEMIESTII